MKLQDEYYSVSEEKDSKKGILTHKSNKDLNFENRISINSIKTKLIDSFVLIGVITALIAFLIPLVPDNFDNLDFYNYLDLVVIFAVFIIYYYRDKLTLKFKGGLILFAVYLFFVSDLYQNGLYSTVMPVFIFIPFLGIIVYDAKWAVLFFIISVITYSLIAYGFLFELIAPGRIAAGMNIYYKWINYGVILSLVSIIVSLYTHIFIQSLIKIIEQQDRNYNVLESQDQELKQNIDEKNVLLQEIHHRVKNNLAVVSGLLDLQSGIAPDDFSRSALKLSMNRILSISKVHELLYQSEDVSRIHFKKYIQELANIIIGSFNKTGLDIELKLDINIPYLNVNHGVPIGIILNELITNSLKHGFNKAQDKYQISVFAHETGDHYEIIYRDNGSGLDEKKAEKATGLGFTLVDSLLNQIEAESTFKMEDMFQLSFRFPKEMP